MLVWFWDVTQPLHREQVRESSIPLEQQQLFLIRMLPVCKCKYHLNTHGKSVTNVMEKSWKKSWKSHGMSWNSVLKIVWEPRSNSIKVTWRVQLRCDTVFMTSSPSSFPRFSLLAVIFRTTLNKITSRRFQQHLQTAPLCSAITFHHFIFTYSPAFAIPQAKRTKQIFESLQCKNAPISSSQVRSRM